MATGSQKTDISSLLKPIDLGLPSILQILNARTTSTQEVVGYLENECDAILECRQCKSLFRSLANFISHKRVYCRGIYRDYAKELQRIIPSAGVEVVEPTDPDTDKLLAQRTKPTANKRSIAAPRKARPVRKSTAADITKLGDQVPAVMKTSPIEGVSCAVSQVAAGSEADGRSSSISNPSDKAEAVTTVEPRDGYPNMSLRQRPSRRIDAFIADWQDEDDEEDFVNMTFTSKSKSQSTSRARNQSSTSKKEDADVKLMKCLPSDTTVPSSKAANVQSKSGKPRKLYPCIYCKNVFTQFWGVTRHLKTFHQLTGDNVDKIREKIRARVYTEPVAGGKQLPEEVDKTRSSNAALSASQSSPAVNNEKKDTSAAPSNKISLSCTNCSKVFQKHQYLRLHMVSCYKKAGLPPPDFQKLYSTTKPILFVCKTCNRAFSNRNNMVQHTASCAKRGKDAVATTADSKEAEAKNAVEESGSQSDDMVEEKGKASDTKAADGKKADPKETQSKKGKESISKAGSSSADKESGSEPATSRGKSRESTSTERAAKVKDEPKSKQSEEKLSPSKLDADDILVQLSPSSAAKEEELNVSPPSTPSTPTSLAQGRSRRNIKPKQFSDGTIRLIEKIPEVVKIQSADGSEVYKLREDVDVAASGGDSADTAAEDEKDDKLLDEDIVKAKDIKGNRILIQGESVPLLDDEDATKINQMIDIRKLVCLQCKRLYGSISNLRRHAVRHLGWRRYKCKLCKFTSYNKSECKSHLRRSHHSEVATLLDGGLAPYIIDLGSLLEDSCEDGSTKLGLSLPVASESGRSSPLTRRTKAKSKEVGPEKDLQVMETESTSKEKTEGPLRKYRGRRRQDTASTKEAEAAKSNAKAAATNAAKQADPAASAPKPRGRPRKQELNVLNNNEMVTQDENNKRARSTRSGLENDSAVGPSPPKVAKVEKPATKQASNSKLKAQSNNLEDLVSKLKAPSKGKDGAKSTRKPLSGTEDNSTESKSADISAVGEAKAVEISGDSTNDGN